MTDREKRMLPAKLVLVATLGVILAGCGGGGGNGNAAGGPNYGGPASTFDPNIEVDVELTGSVGDGPVVGAAMEVYASDGSTLAALESDGTAGYGVTLRTKGQYYPLTIEARNGTDLVTNMKPDFTLKSAVLEPSAKAIANVNPFSTLAVEVARAMPGGLGKSNIRAAESIVSNALNGGLTTLVSSGSRATEITTANAAEIVKASENIGEIVRRSRDRLQAFGYSASGDSVVRAMGSDLVDGAMDGAGGPAADARTAAIVAIVTAAVFAESAANELYVNGSNATSKLNRAIEAILPEAPSPTLGELTVTAQMIARIRTGVSAAMAASSDVRLQALSASLDDLRPGMRASQVRSILPSNYRQVLDDTLALVAGSVNPTIDEINEIVAAGRVLAPRPVPESPRNNPPVIFGLPSTVATAGSAYSFTPRASDTDGDRLTFSIQGLPSWARIDAASGRISGTPGVADIGEYRNIRVSVTDGLATVALPSFSISVNAIGTGSVTLSWIPPTKNEDGTPLLDLAGYRIYWGANPGSYPSSVTIDNPGISSYVVENLAPGTWYFAARSLNSMGVESDRSTPVMRVVQ